MSLALDTEKLRREEMEYPSSSGLYSTAREFGLILQNILCGVSASRGAAPRLLSDASYSNLFRPALAPAQCDTLVGMMNGYAALSKEAGDLKLTQNDVNSGLACVPLYTGRGPKAGWGRGSGSIGWGGAAGTDACLSVECTLRRSSHVSSLSIPSTISHQSLPPRSCRGALRS